MVGGVDDDAGGGGGGFGTPGGLNAVQSGHDHVHQRYVRAVDGSQAHGFLAVGGLSHHPPGRLGGEELP